MMRVVSESKCSPFRKGVIGIASSPAFPGYTLSFGERPTIETAKRIDNLVKTDRVLCARREREQNGKQDRFSE
jgi:hypothetical protein